LAHSLDAILLTEDKDFGDLVVRQRRPVRGVVLLRLNRVGRAERARFAFVHLERLGEKLTGALTVIGAKQVRVRQIA
jgi:predicted nuclease of predicted toxin-antitoxin system